MSLLLLEVGRSCQASCLGAEEGAGQRWREGAGGVVIVWAGR